MQISKTVFVFIIVLVAAVGGTAGYLFNVLAVNQERAELNTEIGELEQEIDQLELQLRAERSEQETADTGTEETSGQ